MGNRLPLLARLSSVAGLTLILIWSFAYLAPGSGLRAVSAQSASPSGTYGFVAVIAQLDSVGSNGGAILGLINFDGAGNVSGTVTVKPRDLNNPQQVIRSNFTGTYSPNPDGTVTVTLNLAIGSTATLFFAFADGGQDAQLIAQTCAPCGANVTLQGQSPSLTGSLPIFLFFPSATGGVPLSLSGVTGNGGGVTVYTANASVGSGAATCPDGSAGNWQASVPSVTLAVNPDISSVANNGGGAIAGNFFAAAIGNICGQADFETINGLVTGTVSPAGATTLTLHAFTGGIASGIARAVNGGSLNGSYGYQLNFSPFPTAAVGVMNFDGVGNVTITGANAGQGALLFLSATGTYSLNPDNTGTINVAQTPGQAGPTFAFVLTDGGSGLLLLRTESNPNFDVAYGTARLQ